MGLRPRHAPSRRPSPPATVQQMRRLAETVNRLLQVLDANSRELAALREEQRTQFKRFAQLQAELDALKHRRLVLTDQPRRVLTDA